ncbi:hypothetical protein [Nocardioides montaniterrae]
MVTGGGAGFAPETPPTAPLVWLLRGIFYTVVGLGITAWARGMREPGHPTPAMVHFLVGVGLFSAVLGLAFVAWGLIRLLLDRRPSE